MDKRYPGFEAFQWHVIDGHGLRCLRSLHKSETNVIVAAGPDAPLLELLTNLSEEPFVETDFVHEEGWYLAERIGDQWEFSLAGGQGQFSMSHAVLLRVFAVIHALRLGNVPDQGEVLDADEWDRRFDWAKESGLLTSRIVALNELAQRYVAELRREGFVPGQSASEGVLAARLAITEALEKEGLTNREQPDAIFYQLRDHQAEHLHLVIDALDMHYGLAQHCQTTSLHVALDWWILEPKRPSNGKMGNLDFVKLCWQTFERQRRAWCIEPIPIEVLGQQMYLVLGRCAQHVELRHVIDEKTFLEAWTSKMEAFWSKKEARLSPVWDEQRLRAADAIWHFPTVLRIFLERFGNGGEIHYVRYLSGEEIVHENDLASWLRPCPEEILKAHEIVDWPGKTLPDGLLCISHYYYNESRAYLLHDGRVVWVTPADDGYSIDPPHLWLWD